MHTNIDTYGTLKHVEHLAVHIGSRMIGSAANHAAEAYIRERLGANGHADLLLVVPDFRELAADVEPAR